MKMYYAQCKVYVLQLHNTEMSNEDMSTLVQERDLFDVGNMLTRAEFCKDLIHVIRGIDARCVKIGIEGEWPTDDINSLNKILQGMSNLRTLEIVCDRRRNTMWAICHGLSRLENLIFRQYKDRPLLSKETLASLPNLSGFSFKCEWDVSELIVDLGSCAETTPNMKQVAITNPLYQKTLPLQPFEKMVEHWPNLHFLYLDMVGGFTHDHLDVLKDCRSLHKLGVPNSEDVQLHLLNLLRKGYFAKLDISKLLFKCPNSELRMKLYELVLQGRCTLTRVYLYYPISLEEADLIIRMREVTQIRFHEGCVDVLEKLILFSSCSVMYVSDSLGYDAFIADRLVNNPLVSITRRKVHRTWSYATILRCQIVRTTSVASLDTLHQFLP